jgi:4-amino-4-deoxy-L-arabinose transferase-like glycosyltransferase
MQEEQRLIRSTDPIGNVLAGVTASHARTIAFLLVVSFLAFVPGTSQIPPVDRDEGRYTQATRQMMETGNYLDIRYQEQVRYLQPIGIYWLQVAAARMTGTAPHAPIWIHRLPSLAGATAAVLLTYWVALPIAGQVGGLMAALLMASSILLGVEARLAKTDAVLLATCLGALGYLARAYLGQTISLAGALLFWTALALGTLVKGPLIALAVGGPAVVLSLLERSTGWLRALRPLYGSGLYLLLVLPWLVAISVISEGGFLRVAIGQSMLGKLAVGQQGHGAPPGFYLVLFWLTFWPGAGLAPIAITWVWKNRRETAIRFCLAWVIPTWLAFELIVTKLPHYVLPVYPAIAILIALALRAGERPGPILRALIVVGGALYALLGAGLLFALERQFSPAALVISTGGVGVLVWAVRCGRRGLPVHLVTGMAGSALLLHCSTFGVVVPRLESIWLSPRLAAAVERQASCPNPSVASAGHNEPSLVFRLGTRTRLGDGVEAAEFLSEGGCRIVLVEKREEPAFLAKLARLGRQAVLRERVTGINIGKVGRKDVGVYTIRSP